MKKYQLIKLNLKINKKILFLSIAIVVNCMFFIYSYSKGCNYFFTNDDYRLRLIASGAYTGDPSYQLVFMKSFVSIFLQILYQVNNAVPWYDILTILCMFIPTTYLLYCLLDHDNIRKSLFLGSLYILFYIFILQKHIMMPQFTITAALFALGSIVSLLKLLKIDKLKCRTEYIIHAVFFVFSNLLCFGIRDEIFLLVLAMELFLLVVQILINKKIVKELSITLIFTIIVCILMQFVDLITLNNSDYKDFKEYTKSRSTLYDYYPAPDYTPNKEFYDSIGLDANTVLAIQNRTLDVDDRLSTDTYIKVAEYSKAINHTSFYLKFRESLIDTIKILMSENLLPQTLIIMFFSIICLISAVYKKQKKELIYLLGCLGYIFFGIILLNYRGRIMDRIVEALYLIIVPLLMPYSITFNRFKMNKIKKDKSLIMIYVMCICLSMAYLASSYFVNKDTLRAQSEWIEKLSTRLNALTSYAVANPENFYFYNALDFIGGSDKLFEHSSDHTHTLNMDSLGNWNAKSPSYYERNEKYGFTSAIDGLINRENVFYVECGKFHSSIEGLLKEKYKRKSKLFDTIIADDGTVINIYKIADLD